MRTIRSTWFRTFLPYCFCPVNVRGRKRVYIPLNRDYKPLGQSTKDWVKYEDYPGHFVQFTKDPLSLPVWRSSSLNKRQRLSEEEQRAKSLYLYYDNPRSTDDYFERLAILARYIKHARPA